MKLRMVVPTMKALIGLDTLLILFCQQEVIAKLNLLLSREMIKKLQGLGIIIIRRHRIQYI
jgi:hypothetical protein